MDARNGEKTGWIGGWLGGFMWVLIVALVFLYKNKICEGIAGLILAGIAFAFIFIFAPWKYPSTKYWKLMLPLLLMLAISVGWAIWAFGNIEEGGYNYWTFLWLITLLLPLFNHGNRKWDDINKEEKSPFC